MTMHFQMKKKRKFPNLQCDSSLVKSSLWLRYSKTPTDNSSTAKATEKTQRLAVQFVVRVSESDINEADFTAVLSPLRFDLLDLHLLGWPVCLQNGERRGVEWGSWDRSWNEPASLLAGPTKAEPFIIRAPSLTKSKWWRPKKNH